MKKIIFFTVFVLFLLPSARADIFDKKDSSPSYDLESQMDEDSRGYYYSGGIDYRPEVPPQQAPSMGFSVMTGSMGCSGFDWGSSFKDLFSEQALADYAKNLSSAAVASAPNVLLSYISPTLADALRNFQNNTNFLLGLRYKQCQDIEALAGDEATKLRAKSEQACIAEKTKQNIGMDKAIKECKAAHDPFAFLKDLNDNPLAKGGEINLADTIAKHLNLSDEQKGLMRKIGGDVTINKKEIKNAQPTTTPEAEHTEKREEARKGLRGIVDNTLAGKDVPDGDLKKLDLPGDPFTRGELQMVALLPEPKQSRAIGNIASQVAYYKTISEYKKVLRGYESALEDPNVADVLKPNIERQYEDTKQQLDDYRETREITKEGLGTKMAILNEVVKEEVRAVNNDDGTTTYFANDAEALTNKGMYLPSNSENQEKTNE